MLLLLEMFSQELEYEEIFMFGLLGVGHFLMAHPSPSWTITERFENGFIRLLRFHQTPLTDHKAVWWCSTFQPSAAKGADFIFIQLESTLLHCNSADDDDDRHYALTGVTDPTRSEGTEGAACREGSHWMHVMHLSLKLYWCLCAACYEVQAATHPRVYRENRESTEIWCLEWSILYSCTR